MADFTVDIPISMSGQSGGTGKLETIFNKLDKGITKLDKDIILTLDTGEVIFQAVTDLYQLIQPLIKILSLLILVFFLPIIPIIKALTEVMVMAVKGWMEISKLLMPLTQALAGFLGFVLMLPSSILAMTVIGLADLLKTIWGIIITTFNVFRDVGSWIIENIIIPSFMVFLNIGQWIIDNLIIPPFKALADFISLIGEKVILPAWDFMKQIGIKVWDIIKAPFEWFRDKFKAMINAIIGVINKAPFVNIPKLAEGGIVTKPTIAMIGEKGSEAVIPLNKMNNVSIVINNPSVRKDSDIKSMADEISKILQRRVSGRVSQ